MSNLTFFDINNSFFQQRYCATKNRGQLIWIKKYSHCMYMNYKNRSLSDAVWIQISIKHLAYLNQQGIPEQTVVFLDVCKYRARDLRKKGISRNGNRWLLNANRGIDRAIFLWLNWPVETNHINPCHKAQVDINLTSPWFTCSCPLIFIEEFYYPIGNGPHTETCPEIAIPFSSEHLIGKLQGSAESEDRKVPQFCSFVFSRI